MNHHNTPLFDAVKKYVADNISSFHVPGHKQGRGIPELVDYIGKPALLMDVNGMKDLDYANNPCGVIAQAQDLFASAFSADHAYLLVNGTTSGVQAMIMSACSPGDEIIIPRNAHKSTIGGIILSGTVPVYIQPEINQQLGIAMGVTVENLTAAIKKHPYARAVFLVNPTYYGFTSDISTIVKIAHAHHMAVLVDEAHGAHMYFHESFPAPAMQAGADMSAASIHKTAGSMTQSSVLLLKSELISPDKVRQVLNLSYTSSASYLLMCSLDIARKQLATRGRDLLDKALRLSRYARSEINKIANLYAFGRELIGEPGCHGFDETKLGIHVKLLGYSGYQAEAKLREEYRIQVELSDLYNLLAVVSIADREEDLQLLLGALKEMSLKAERPALNNFPIIPHNTEMIVSPREAFYHPKKTVGLKDSIGEIAGENIMAYPPGIPVICMGERITQDLVDYIQILKKENCELQGTADPGVDYIRVLGKEHSRGELIWLQNRLVSQPGINSSSAIGPSSLYPPG